MMHIIGQPTPNLYSFKSGQPVYSNSLPDGSNCTISVEPSLQYSNGAQARAFGVKTTLAEYVAGRPMVKKSSDAGGAAHRGRPPAGTPSQALPLWAKLRLATHEPTSSASTDVDKPEPPSDTVPRSVRIDDDVRLEALEKLRLKRLQWEEEYGDEDLGSDFAVRIT